MFKSFNTSSCQYYNEGMTNYTPRRDRVSDNLRAKGHTGETA
jgi:hypothetical protein